MCLFDIACVCLCMGVRGCASVLVCLLECVCVSQWVCVCAWLCKIEKIEYVRSETGTELTSACSGARLRPPSPAWARPP